MFPNNELCFGLCLCQSNLISLNAIILNFTIKKSASGKRSGDESDRSERPRRKRKRCSRWEPEDKKVNLGAAEVVNPQSLANPPGIMKYIMLFYCVR